MKNIILTVILCLVSCLAMAQATNGSVGIGTENPEMSAVLDVTGSNKGFLVPRLQLVAATDSLQPVSHPAEGLLVYNTGGNLAAGFYYWDGQRWLQLSARSTLAVTTAEITNIVLPTATCGGTITDDGGYEITACGVCWDTIPNPTLSDSHTTDTPTDGTFTSSITGLQEMKTYFVRAYVTAGGLTVYGEQRTLCTGNITYNVGDVTFTMIYVEGGTYPMGSRSGEGFDDERPQHNVQLSDFWIGEVLVTQKMWHAVMGKTIQDQAALAAEQNITPRIAGEGDDYPIYYVSWNDICNGGFLDSLNIKLQDTLNNKHFALPTEAQWEYAARGGKQTHGYSHSGCNADDLTEYAWYGYSTQDPGNATIESTHEVAKFRPNELGIYDMSGNLQEWCHDWYHITNTINYYQTCHDQGTVLNPQGPDNGAARVVRGGSFYDAGEYCRVAYRSDFAPDTRATHVGFRVVLQ